MNNNSAFIKEFIKSLKMCSQIREKELSDNSVEPLLSYLYTPDKRLKNFISELDKKIEIANLPKKERPKNFHNLIGQFLEKIAFLCLKSLLGVSSIKSFQSAGPQYDFLVTGDNEHWKTLCELLYLDFNKRDILVEVKATKNKVSDQQFARLCSLLELNLFSSGGLGIFFTLSGATGFPDENSKKRQRALRDARLRQVMYKVSSEKSIVVFDRNDINKLDKPGSFVKLLISKIRDIEQLDGLYCSPEVNVPCETDLPMHLKKY